MNNTYLLDLQNVSIIVSHKPIKNFYLRISRSGKVKVSAPFSMNEQTIRELVLPKLNWIQKYQERYKNLLVLPYQYISGEQHYYWGKTYPLEVILGKSNFLINLTDQGKIILVTHPDSDRETREKIMRVWYRQEMEKITEKLFTYWQEKLGLFVNQWAIKAMKTRWGTCNYKAKRIWLNLDLIKRPQHCLEFIIVHELTHLLEPRHNYRFKAYLDQFLPPWRAYKRDLNIVC